MNSDHQCLAKVCISIAQPGACKLVSLHTTKPQGPVDDKDLQQQRRKQCYLAHVDSKVRCSASKHGLCGPPKLERG